MWSIFAIAMLFFITLLLAHRNTYRPVTTHIQLPVKQSGLSNLRILHLSDIHMENLSVSSEKLLAEIHGQPIDLIALTGDYLDRVRSHQKVLDYLLALVQLKPKYGIYLVFGNHDYVLKERLLPLKKDIEALGIHVLQNENRTVHIGGEKLVIIGIDDYSTRRSDVKKAFTNVKDGFRLVLTHDPNVVLKMKDVHYDYLLAGHFHGGQIHWPRPYHLAKMGKLARQNIIKGLHYDEGKPFYISEGLGQTGINIRLRSRPEITFHTLMANAAGKEKAS